jgi:hypothetical protein
MCYFNCRVKYPKVYVNKIQQDKTVFRYLFTAKSLYMFRLSPHPSSGVDKTLTAVSGTGHNVWPTTFLQLDQIRTGLGQPGCPRLKLTKQLNKFPFNYLDGAE